MVKQGRFSKQYLGGGYGGYMPVVAPTAAFLAAQLAQQVGNIAYNRYKQYVDNRVPMNVGGTSTGVQTIQPYPYPRGKKTVRSIRSAGFAGRKMKKLKRTNRPRLSLKKSNGSAPYVNLVQESGGSAADRDCVYVGHTTAPWRLLMKAMTYALVKKLAKGFGIIIDNFADLVDARMRIGTTIGLNFYNTSIAATDTYTSYAPVPGETYATLASQITQLIAAAASSHRDIEFKKLYIFRADDDIFEIDLRRLKFQVQVKSSLKMQNRSKNALGNEADEVDNVPVYGRSYQSSYTGLRYVDNHRVNPGLTANDSSGIVRMLGGSDTTNSLKEPPLAGVFRDCKMFGKVRIEPGSLKTSVLTSKHSFLLDGFFKICNAGLGFNYANIKLGKCRVFAMEKILDAGDESDINVSFEVNSAVYCNLKYLKGTGTPTVFSKVAVA